MIICLLSADILQKSFLLVISGSFHLQEEPFHDHFFSHYIELDKKFPIVQILLFYSELFLSFNIFFQCKYGFCE